MTESYLDDEFKINVERLVTYVNVISYYDGHAFVEFSKHSRSHS
jgi:hypothetical protein